jgi:hypothetical protein
MGGRRVHAGQRFIVFEGGWADSPYDGWIVPGWMLNADTTAVLDRMGVPALVLSLANIQDDHPGHGYAVWHTPPGVDPRHLDGHAHDVRVEVAEQQGWFTGMPYMHSTTSHQDLAAAAAGGVLPRFRPL